MRGKDSVSGVRGVALINLQKQYVIRATSLLRFVRNLKQRLCLGRKEFNICFVDDNAIRHLNLVYRGKDRATDVLSFPWAAADGVVRQEPRAPSHRRQRDGITNFLGDVVISVPTARRNASGEGHSTLNEIRWLILHGVLHLLGYDHECDSGAMIALELALREQLGVAGEFGVKKKIKRQKFARSRL